VNVWLDDERPIPAGYDTHVKTAQEAIALLKTGKVTGISLDHDLGENAGDGYEVAKFIEEGAITGTLERLHVTVHTHNMSARPNMLMALRNAKIAWMERNRTPGEAE